MSEADGCGGEGEAKLGCASGHGGVVLGPVGAGTMGDGRPRCAVRLYPWVLEVVVDAVVHLGNEVDVWVDAR